MDPANVLNVMLVIIVVYLAFRVGAFLMKVLLGLLAIGLVVWLVTDLIGAVP